MTNKDLFFNIAVPILFIAIAWILVYFSPVEVTLSAKEFTCTSASPEGLNSKCDVYMRNQK